MNRSRRLGPLTLLALLAPLAACSSGGGGGGGSGSGSGLTGTITDAQAQPIAGVSVALFRAADSSQIGGVVETGSDGAYAIDAPAGDTYVLVVAPRSGSVEQGYALHGHRPIVLPFELEAGGSTRDFVLNACHDFVFEGYDDEGNFLADGQLGGLQFAVDAQGAATDDLLFGVPRVDSGPGAPGLCVALGRTYTFYLQWTLEGFGSLVLPVDDGGAGYRPQEIGGTVLALNLELARTQVARLDRALRTARRDGYTVPPEIDTGLADARAIVEGAGQRTGAEQAALADNASRQALASLEALELSKSEQDIPRYRTGSLTVRVLDPTGAPATGAVIDFQQVSHDFLFGAFDEVESVGTEGYDIVQDAGIDYATSGFFWSRTEPRQDQLDFDYVDETLGVPTLSEQGFTLQAHALLAFWDFNWPDYLRSMTIEELEAEVEQHVGDLVGRYADEVSIWNVINEAHGRGTTQEYTRNEITRLTRAGSRAIRQHDPDAQILVNNALDWFGESKRATFFETGQRDDFTLPVPAYLQELVDDGVDFDIIGLQAYNGGQVTLLEQAGIADAFPIPSWDLGHLSRVVDDLAVFGKPVHITEHSVPSEYIDGSDELGAGWWHDRWNEATQAEDVRAIYTLFFGKKHVQSITWWNISDRNAFIADGGLLDITNRPKPSLAALESLIDDWTSEGTVATDGGGRATIAGFGGDYELTVTHDGQTTPFSVHVTEQTGDTVTVRLGG